jgi:putative ABC transport system ATP-binding protein
MLEARDVRKSYPGGEGVVEALRGITLDVPDGACAFIVGPSGSGKSTLLHLLGAMDRPSSGTIRIGDRDLTAMSEGEQDAFRRTQVGFVFQAFNLIGNLSALDNVLVPFLPVGVPATLRQKALDLLARVGLGDRTHHRPHQLSGGQLQRVAIARALLKEPVLLLADEPTGELDSKTGDEVFRILRREQVLRRNTLLVVTHDRRFITDRDLVFELEDGLLVNGSPSAIARDDDRPA